MSEQNARLFARVTEAYRRRDVDAFLELAHPDVEWHPAFDVVLGGETAVYQRHDGIRKMFREVDEALSSVHVEWFEIRDLGERIVAIGRLRVCGRGSGAETESPVAVVVDLVDKKVRRVRTYLDPPQALEAAGLRE